ncbi:hypothetical protein [uncultured Fibrobacter sp.]|uniref:hypothetical protein n=1 Tax=uncultured Fibrobacter sp. TaxID=261512 RepID=UPI002805AF6E|nr:hypothetical protein [uncultured Fibrobacter sp.]
MSLLLPFAAFTNLGPLSFYPELWMEKPLEYAHSFDDGIRFFTWVLFFGFAVRKLVQNKFLKNICISASLVLAIAFYWWCCGGGGGIVFLYQVQTFRVEWIGMILFLPIWLIIAYQRIRRFQAQSALTTYDLSLLLLGLTIFLPAQLISTFLLGAFFIVKKEKSISIKAFQILVAGMACVSLLYQSGLDLFLQGAPKLFIREFTKVNSAAESLVLTNSIFCLIAAIILLKQKRNLLGLLFALYCLYPSQLLPIIGIFLWIKKVKFPTVVLLLFLMFSENALNGGFRISGPPIPRGLRIAAILNISFLISSIPLFFKCRLRFIGFALFFIGVSVYAYISYDQRSELQKASEKQINSFLQKELFPQIQNAGRTLYYVSGLNEAKPRMQFLTGGCFDKNSLTGSIFFEKHYMEGNRRRNLLYYKTDSRPYQDHDRGDFPLFVKKVLSNKDSLEDRFRFLCLQNEVHHLVTEFSDLSFTKRDSAQLDIFKQRVFLYSCEEANSLTNQRH